MLSYELREQVLDYINNRIDLEGLEDWYVPRLRQFVKDPNSADAEVVAVIELAVVHLADGVQDEDEVRDMLWEVLSKHSSVMHLDLTEPTPQPINDQKKAATMTSAESNLQLLKMSFPLRGISVSYSQ